MDSIPTSLALAGAATVGGLVLYAATRSSGRRLPPGPTRYPVIGCLPSWPAKNEWVTFKEWREQYGDIVYANLAGTSILVINSPEAAKSIFVDHALQNSDRPRMILMGEIVGWEHSPLICTYNHPSFKTYRRMMLNTVGSRASVDSYVSMEEHEAHRFLLRVIDNPEKLLFYIRKYSGTIILRVLYGYDVKPEVDEYVDLIDRSNKEFEEASTPGSFMVDLIPALRYVPRWFPGTSWMNVADSMRQHLNEILSKPINFVKEEMAAGRARPSFVSNEMSRVDYDESVDGKNLGWAAVAMYAGGGDTTVSAIYSFFLAMTAFPDAQVKAQAEIDLVLGPDALPTWTDAQRLPYVKALVKEVLRWAPVGPKGFPHVSTEDIYYQGYFIPKGTISIPNLWGFTRDTSVYPDPEEFLPERFLGQNPQPDPYNFLFGYGRRICPGQQLAEVSTFLLMANSLAALSITPKIGADGVPIQPKIGWSGMNMIWADKWDYDIKPRSKTAETLIRSVNDAPYAS
ncbi:cytochrome P450 [Auriculariales sp. MPI-PUGE-AT-0066]|nr:cytochrome P450 [Auriculariales sp. MPI-PUGE-AT-0066]